MRTRKRGLRGATLLALTGALLVACSSDSGVAGPDVPAQHTQRIGGAWHKSGLGDPLTNCVSCHGSDLRGGDEGQPSCYTCHGEKWN